MNNIKVNRFLAYFIDLIIISLLVSILCKINFLNPYQDKYHKVLKEYNTYAESMKERISEINSIKEVLTPKYIDYMHKMELYSLSYTIIEIFVIVLYFTLFPIFNNNSTVGQRLLKLKLVNYDESKRVKKSKYFIRSLFIPIVTSPILYATILNIVCIPFLFILSSKYYIYFNLLVTGLCTIYAYIDIIVLLSSKDGISLHDKLTKTRLIKC